MRVSQGPNVSSGPEICPRDGNCASARTLHVPGDSADWQGFPDEAAQLQISMLPANFQTLQHNPSGNVYLVDKLKTQADTGDSYRKEIVVPKYVKNVAKVQIWCSFAEVNLGEASFSSPVM
jgi:hypothetical protein